MLVCLTNAKNLRKMWIDPGSIFAVLPRTQDFGAALCIKAGTGMTIEVNENVDDVAATVNDAIRTSDPR